MFRFFRKIRYKLLDEGHLSKYTYYAIGEILLVVIGILIALQINNWNEERNNNKQLKKYFITIENNLKSDIKQLNDHYERRERMRENNKKAAEALFNKEHDIDIYLKAHVFFYEYYFTPNDRGYQALLNSGLTNQYANTELDNLLSEYYVELDNLHENETSFNNFIEDVESKFRQRYPAITFDYLARAQLRHSSLEEEKVEELKLRKDELMPYFLSPEFEAGVLRASTQSNRGYLRLIEQAQNLVKVLEDFRSI